MGGSLSPEAIARDDFYDLPVYEYRTAADFVPTRDPAIHRIIWEGGTIVLAAAIRDSPMLTVTYHGALQRAKDRTPFFHRLLSRKRSTESFVAFSDPTLDLDPALGLGWYIGGADHDPTPTFVSIVRRVQGIAGSQAVAFCGGSGGGFAALQHSAEFPGSIAVPFNPQTDAYNYFPGHRKRLLEAAFPGHTADSARALYARRLSAVVRYGEPLTNRVRYVLNQNDPHHVEKHAQPFAELFGLETSGGQTADGRVEIVPVDLGQGHVSPPRAVFESQLAAAYRTLGFELVSPLLPRDAQ